jgi:hypothetical protein
MHTASQSRHDVVIVGARAAGAATAMPPARLGHHSRRIRPAHVPASAAVPGCLGRLSSRSPTNSRPPGHTRGGAAWKLENLAHPEGARP